jgi:hypothetical protein
MSLQLVMKLGSSPASKTKPTERLHHQAQDDRQNGHKYGPEYGVEPGAEAADDNRAQIIDRDADLNAS